MPSTSRTRSAAIVTALWAASLGHAPAARAAHIDVNRIDMIVSKGASFGHDAPDTLAGLEYPRGSGKHALFAGGLWIGARVGGVARVAVAMLGDEFAPGSLVNGIPDDPGKPTYKVYELRRNYVTIEERDSVLSDYVANAVPLGAPPVAATVAGLDITGHRMLWHVYNDADPARHLLGSTAPLGVEVRQTTFAYDEVGTMGNTILFRYQILNRGLSTLDSVFVGIWADPDIGAAGDDLVGYDRARGLGYAYNSDDNDAIYDGDPPALGIQLLRGPVVAGDTLSPTAFVRIIHFGDPVNGEEMYQTMLGRHPDGSPFLDPVSLQVTTFTHAGDPVLGTGWLDLLPADRRMLIATGPFTLAPGNSQAIFAALVVGDGADNLNAITALRSASDDVRSYFRRSFDRTTAVEVSLAHADAEPGRVRLTWVATESPGMVATVERAEAPDAWSPLAAITADARGTLEFEDADVVPGRRYGYRLRFDDGTASGIAGETWLDVPAGLALALEGARPNPAERDLTIGFVLPDAGPARLELFDVEGRRRAARDVGALGAGRHLVRFGEGSHLDAGLYFLRLSAAGRVLSARVSVMR